LLSTLVEDEVDGGARGTTRSTGRSETARIRCSAWRKGKDGSKKDLELCGRGQTTTRIWVWYGDEHRSCGNPGDGSDQSSRVVPAADLLNNCVCAVSKRLLQHRRGSRPLHPRRRIHSFVSPANISAPSRWGTWQRCSKTEFASSRAGGHSTQSMSGEMERDRIVEPLISILAGPIAGGRQHWRNFGQPWAGPGGVDHVGTVAKVREARTVVSEGTEGRIQHLRPPICRARYAGE